MAKYIMVGKGKKVHIIGDSDRATLCGLKLKHDGYARYMDKLDTHLDTCDKCHDIIYSIVNA